MIGEYTMGAQPRAASLRITASEPGAHLEPTCLETHKACQDDETRSKDLLNYA